MADLSNRANVNTAIDTLLNDLQPNGAILPSNHNGLLKDILDTLANGLSVTLRTNPETGGQDIEVTSGDKLKFKDSSFFNSVVSQTLTADRTLTLPNKTGTVATLSDIPAGSNISNADLTFDANHYADLGSYSWTLGGTAPVGTSKICLLKDVLVKGTDNAEATTGFKVTDVNNDLLFDIRNNGQIGYGGIYRNLYAHTFRNPNNEANIASFDNGVAGIESFIIQTNGRFKSQQSGQDIFLSYRQSGQSWMKLYDAGVESIRLGKLGSFINGALRVGGVSGSTTGTTGARFEIQQQSTNTFQQLFFANSRTVTLGRINSSGSFTTTQAGLECYDTDINKKYFWNGTDWEKIKGNIESVSVATATTLTPNVDTSEMEIVSALAGALTIASPTGTPHEGQELIFRIKDDGTARGLTWNAIFVDYTGLIPSTTVANKTVYVGCKYNAIDTKWDVVAVQVQP